ncbi:MAG: FecR domain-containing protein [Bacteroidota bacterium]
MNTNNPKDEFLARWLDGRLPEEEVQSWEASGDLTGLTQVVEEASRLEVPATRSKEQAWEDFLVRTQQITPLETPQQTELDSSTTKVVKFPRKTLMTSLIAASAAILLLIYVLIPQPKKINIPVGAEPFTLNLPDGSKTILNDQSSLSYEPSEWAGNREVNLKGEAFFQVEEGSRFLVQTPQGQVQVLGTSFNVFVRDDRLEVTCFTGKVQVKSPKMTDATILTRGESVIIDKNDIQASKHQPSQSKIPTWIEGSFQFEQAPFSHVTAEVERQFGVTIDVKGLEDQKWSGVFFDDNLEETLRLICEPMGLTYTQENATYIRLIKKP